MTDKKDIYYREVLNSTLSEIAAKVDTFLQANTDEIAERYGTNSPTKESILKKLYQKPLSASEPIDVALALKIFLADAHQLFYRVEEQRKTLPAPLLIYNMGVLLDARGKPAEAEAYLREALEGRRRVLGEA